MLYAIVIILLLSVEWGRPIAALLVAYAIICGIPSMFRPAKKRRNARKMDRREAKQRLRNEFKAPRPLTRSKDARRSTPSIRSAFTVPAYHAPSEPLKAWTICNDILNQAHVLVGGTTGAGKSTLAHSVIYSLCASDPYVKSFYGIDLKRVELSCWRSTPHCKEIATTPEQALAVINTVSQIVDIRLNTMERCGQRTYSGGDIYIVIDELAELLAVDRGKVVAGLSRIMRLGRAAKVHVIGFTQAPNRGKGGGLDPLLCQNFTAAVALRCRSAIESRQIVGIAGAESLPKYGKGIYWSGDGTREVIVPMTTDEQINERIESWKE